jgi:hypothetical protein
MGVNIRRFEKDEARSEIDLAQFFPLQKLF